MNIILVTGILLIIISVLCRKTYNPYLGFAFVFLIMGFQSNVEGDFMTYANSFDMIGHSNVFDARNLKTEPVFPNLMRFFTFGPFWFFILCLSLFQTYVLTTFVRNYGNNKYHYIAPILFFFSFPMMLMQMKALRQGLAVEFVLLAIVFIDKAKNFIPPLICSLLAYYSHNSSMVVLPFVALYYLINRKPEILNKDILVVKGKNIFPLFMVSIFLLVYIIKLKILNQYLGAIAMLSDNRLASYADSSATGRESIDANIFDISPLIVLYDALMVFLVAWFMKRTNPKMRVFCIVTIVSCIFDMLFFGLGTLARMIMYLMVFSLVVYPSVALEIKKQYGPLWVTLFIVLLVGYAVKTSLPWMLGTDDGRFGTYQFVFLE